MRTPKQIAASRANGARSKGPVTEQGKRNSSRNSTRHGLFAETIVLENEKEEEFFELLNELLDEHQPATPTETMMVEAIAAARWRQDRIWGMQKVAFDHDVASSPTTSTLPPLRAVLSLHSSADSVRSHELLLRYDIAFDRQISRALLRLQQLQDRRAKRTEEQCAANSVLGETIKTAEDAERPSAPTEKPAAPTPVIAHSKDTRAERTRQPIETKLPIADLPARKFTSASAPRDRKLSQPRDVPSLRVR